MPGDASHGTILYVEDITVSFDGFEALNNLTLYIDVGELRCIIGPNGAGKTTMMDVITGKTRPDSGSAWFGQSPPICSRSPNRKSRRPALAANSRNPRSSSTTRVLQNLALAAAGNKRVWSHAVQASHCGATRAHR